MGHLNKLAVLPLPNKLFPAGAGHGTLTVILVVPELAYILRSIGEDNGSMTVLLPELELPRVSAVGPGHHTLAMGHPVFKLPHVSSPIGIGQGPLAFKEAVLPLPRILLAVGEGRRTLSFH